MIIFDFFLIYEKILNKNFNFKECGPFDENASVIQIQDHSFDVLIFNLGIVKRIYCDVN